MIMNKNTKYIQLIDYEEYSIFMESKKVRHGKDRTYTLVDFIADEELAELNRNEDYDLSRFNPTPKAIYEHFKFTNKIHKQLLKKYPNDMFLKRLEAEKYQVLKVTTNWYEDYGISYPDEKMKALANIKFL